MSKMDKILQAYLKFYLRPAYQVYEDKRTPPLCFATLAAPGESEREHCQKYGVKDGSRVKVVMASRLGDVGITTRLDAENGYDVRVEYDWLKDFNESPALPERQDG